MKWTDYVGETFQTLDGKLFNAESYDSRVGFCMREHNKPKNRLFVHESQMGYEYRMVIECQPPKMRYSIKSEEEGWNLLDRAIFNLDMGIPLPELVKTFMESGFSSSDIYLTIKAAQIILKNR